MKVIEFEKSVESITNLLREIADDIEAGRMPEPDTLAVVSSGGDGLTVRRDGRYSGIPDVHLTLSCAVHAIRDEVIGFAPEV